MTVYEPELKDFSKEYLVYKENVGPYWEMAPAIEETYEWGKKHPEMVSGPLMILFCDNPREVAPENCRARICFPVRDGEERAEGFQTMEIEKSKAVSLIYEGTYASLEKVQAYKVLYNWLKKHPEYELKEKFLIERYLNSPEDTPEEKLKTEIILLVKKKD
jgi:DNA gyrase inhibitor GyrI